MVARANGTVHGRNITLDDDVGLPDGARVNVQLESVDDDWPRRRANIMKLFGVWQNDEELGRIFDEIIEERHRRLPRDVEF